MDYEVLYSINYINMPAIIYITLAIAVIFIIIIIMLLITQRKIISSPKVMGALIIIAVMSGLFGERGAYSHLSNANSLKSGDYNLIEGKIENFVSASSSPKGFESFQVNDKMFQYSNALINGGLSHSIADSGLMKNGSDVKVYYKNKAILRIEVKK